MSDNQAQIDRVWEIFDMFDAMPYIDEGIQQQISERLRYLFMTYGINEYERGKRVGVRVYCEECDS